MTNDAQQEKVGRPPENIIEPIDDKPENVAKSIMQSPPKKDWDYLRK